MKYKIFVLLFLISLLVFCNCEECYKNDTNLFEMYCDNFTATMPVECVNHEDSYLYILFDTQKKFKSGGCDLNIVYLVLNLNPFSIASLDLSYSGYSKLIPFYGENEYLVTFNVSHNKISEIPDFFVYNTPNITEIDLSFNKIKNIGKYVFERASQLTTIFLSHNEIAFIDTEVFAKLNVLTFIDLSNNSIRSVNYLFKNNIQLKTLLLKENLIKKFNCELSQLVKNGASVSFSWANIIFKSLVSYLSLAKNTSLMMFFLYELSLSQSHIDLGHIELHLWIWTNICCIK